MNNQLTLSLEPTLDAHRDLRECFAACVYRNGLKRVAADYKGDVSARMPAPAASKNGKRVAGLSPYMPEAGGPANVWSVYLNTSDCAATAAAAKSAGATVMVEPVAVGSALPKVDRAFDAIYPAGDLALLMLAVRIAISHVARRRVATLLVGAGVLFSKLSDANSNVERLQKAVAERAMQAAALPLSPMKSANLPSAPRKPPNKSVRW